MKVTNYFLLFHILVLVISCNPSPKEDNHPETPLIDVVLKDSAKSEKFFQAPKHYRLSFLKDDRMLLSPDDSELPFKILDLNKNIVFSQTADWFRPIYFDATGNVFMNNKKYFYPDYKKMRSIKP